LKKAVIIFLLLFGVGFSYTLEAQSGGKKREKRVRTKKRGNSILTQYKSHGHADEFARGSSGRHSKIYRLFHKPKPAWQYKSSGSRRSHNSDNRDLFSRERSKGRVDNEGSQMRQGRDRSRRRDHGSVSFLRRKYRR
jgi:hypothetical protein